MMSGAEPLAPPYRRRPARGAALLGWAAAAVAASAGCANGRVSDQDAARGTVRTFLAQCTAGRGVRVLETLNPAARATFVDAGGTRRGCATVLRAPAGARLPAAGAARLIAFDGTRAQFAVAAPGGGAALRLTASRGAEGWRIEGPW